MSPPRPGGKRFGRPVRSCNQPGVDQHFAIGKGIGTAAQARTPPRVRNNHAPASRRSRACPCPVRIFGRFLRSTPCHRRSSRNHRHSSPAANHARCLLLQCGWWQQHRPALHLRLAPGHSTDTSGRRPLRPRLFCRVQCSTVQVSDLVEHSRSASLRRLAQRGGRNALGLVPGHGRGGNCVGSPAIERHHEQRSRRRAAASCVKETEGREKSATAHSPDGSDDGGE